MGATHGKKFPGSTRSGGDAEAVTIDGDPGELLERERRLIEAVVSLARSLRDERDRLAERLREVESQLGSLAQQIEHRAADAAQPKA